MFQRVSTVATQGSPSFQSNNLSSHGSVLCYIRMNDVLIIDDTKFSKIAVPRSQLYEVAAILAVIFCVN
jgi:hypothetical protein